MSITKIFRRIVLLITGIPMLQVYSQLVLQDTTITTSAMFAANNYIIAGPNFAITHTGDVTFVTDGYVYFKPRIVIVGGGRFQAVKGPVGVRTTETSIPANFSLQQNYPNPFNPSTNIRFAVKEKSHVSLIVFNLLGQPVTTLVNEELPAGEYEAPFSPNGLASGVYFCRMTANGFIESRRMLLLK